MLEIRTDEAFYNISMYLHNKNVLEYDQIARNETESKIPYIEGCSNAHNPDNQISKYLNNSRASVLKFFDILS